MATNKNSYYDKKGEKFAAFILTHGRPDKVTTFQTLRKQGYTGKIYIIVDNEDEAIDAYRERFGDSVIVFDKLAISKTFDNGDNFDDRRTVIYARNASFGIAEGLGLDYFLQLDDDSNRNAEQQGRDDGDVPERGHLCKVFLFDYVCPLLRQDL